MSTEKMKHYHKRHGRTKIKGASRGRGQALIEYALILSLAIIGVIAILTITGPVIGNVFSTTFNELLGRTTEPQATLSEVEFWNVVTAVASHTPEEGLINPATNTPPAGDGDPDPDDDDWDDDGFPNDVDDCPHDPGIDNPNPGKGCPDFDGDGVSDPNDACLTVPGPVENNGCPYDDAPPSPTPEDIEFTYPFFDPVTPIQIDWWQTEYDGMRHGEWDAEYWDKDGSGNGYCNDGSWLIDFNTGDFSTDPKVTTTEDKLVFPRPNHNWSTGSGSPHPNISDDFCARFEKEIELPTGDYEFRYVVDDGIWIYVDGVKIVDDPDWDSDMQTVSWTNNKAEAQTIRIVYTESGGPGRLEVSLVKSDYLTHRGFCDWKQGKERFKSAAYAWDDSEYEEYFTDSRCALRLRGYIPLTSAVNPVLHFWDAFELGRDYDRAILALRATEAEAGDPAGIDDWTYVVVHEYEFNYAFERQTFDLTQFTGDMSGTANDGQTFNYVGKNLEMHFILESDTQSDVDDGWWIDNVQVVEDVSNVYTLGFLDTVEDAEHWVAGGTWARSIEAPYEGSLSWSDSPGQHYEDRTSSTLTLNGVLDLTQGTVENPEVAFWTKYSLGDGDMIFVEMSLDRKTWYSLPSGDESSSANALADATSVSDYTMKVLPIPDMFHTESRIFVRFRLDALSNGDVDDGWWIDNIEFRNRPNVSISPNFCDDMEAGSDYWAPEGTWAITNEKSYEGVQAWSDSPNSKYNDGSNSSLVFQPSIDLTQPGTPSADHPTLVRPIIEFWHRWEVNDNDHILVELGHYDASDQLVWEGVPLWSYSYNDPDDSALPNYGTSISGQRFNEQKSWVREVIELTDYIGQKDLFVRFRLDARVGSATDDGWYIDHFCVREAAPPVVGIPFADDLENGDNNWYVGGEWAMNGEDPWLGDNQFSVRPNGNYNHKRNNVLELLPSVRVESSLAQPTLYFWEAYHIANQANHFASVEVRVVNEYGHPQGDWEQINICSGCDAMIHNQDDFNHGWTRQQVDLTPYKGQYIRLRWRLNAAPNGDNENFGWMIDQISIVDRATLETIYTVQPAYYEDIESISDSNNEWVLENEWDAVSVFREQAENTTLGPGQWTVEWFDGVQNACQTDAHFTNPASTSTVYTIDFNWGNDHPDVPGITGSNTFGAIFTREVFFEVDTTFVFSGRTDDGLRIYDNGSIAYNRWWCQDSYYESSPYTFSAGTHQIQIFYYENGGGAALSVNFQKAGTIGEGRWTTQWYNGVVNPNPGDSNICNGDAMLTNPAGNTQVNTLDFNWGNGSPSGVGITNSDTFGAVFIREFSFIETKEINFGGEVDDGIRIYSTHNGNRQLLFEDWECQDTSFNTETFEFAPGVHYIEIHYYESTGGAELKVEMGQNSRVFHESPGEDYEHNVSSSAMLEGMIDLSGFGADSYPALLWEDKFDLDRYDSAIIEISTDGGFTWTEVYRKTYSDDEIWKERVVDLHSFVGNDINIRFRLDARNHSNTDDGWWIDNIRVLE